MDTTPISPAVLYSQLVPGCSYLGADSYTARTDIISSGSDGDVYQCTVTSVGDPVTDTVTLRGNDLS